MDNCIYCGGTLKLANGEPCPHCKSERKKNTFVIGIPYQYQGVTFNKDFLPEESKGTYGDFMESLLNEIITNYAFYQKNILICSKPNTGKTIWAYDLYAKLGELGYTVAPIKDIYEVRTILTSYDSTEDAALISTAKCAIIKIPPDMQFWLFDSILTIIDRRIRANGFTIFLFDGTKEDLSSIDRNNRLKSIAGNGSYHTLSIKSF